MARKRRVLVADESSETRRALIWLLLSNGFEVACASNGLDAAGALEGAQPPDVAIIDLGLRVLNGRQLIEAVKRSDKYNGIEVFAAGECEPFVPLPAGVTFLKKPYDHDLIVRHLGSAMESGVGREATFRSDSGDFGADPRSTTGVARWSGFSSENH